MQVRSCEPKFIYRKKRIVSEQLVAMMATLLVIKVLNLIQL